MANVQMTVEFKVYKKTATSPSTGSFSATIVTVNGVKELVERNSGSPVIVAEKALEKVSAENVGAIIEVTANHDVLNDGEREYLTDKFGVVFA